MSSPNGPGNPHDAGQPYPQYPGPAGQPPYGAQYPPPAPPPYAQHPQPAPKTKSKALPLAITGGVLALVLAVVVGALVLGRSDRMTPGAQSPADGSTASGTSPPSGLGQNPSGTGGQSLLGKGGEELLPLMPTAGDFPQGTQVQAFIDAPGEANGDDRVKPLPAEATNPPGCWTHLEIRKNRDDLPDITRVVTTLDKNDKGQTIAAAQIAKENNNVDAIGQAKAWLGQCQEFDYIYQLKDGQPPVHFKLSALPGPPAFSDPFFGVKLTELGPQGPAAYTYFFAARVRGLLVLSQGVCDVSTCDENQNSQLAQQIPIMFSKIVQGLRNMR